MEIRDSEKSLVFFILYICKMKKIMTIFTKVHIKKNANNENNLCKSLIHKLKKNIFFEQPIP